MEWILEALSGYAGRFEVILVDDGSRDDTWSQVVAASVLDRRVHGLRLGRNVGQTAAMMAGFDHARGRVVVSLDGDLQNDPRDIPALVAKLDEGYDLVCGWRQRRQFPCRVMYWLSWQFLQRITSFATSATNEGAGLGLVCVTIVAIVSS